MAATQFTLLESLLYFERSETSCKDECILLDSKFSSFCEKLNFYVSTTKLKDCEENSTVILKSDRLS